MPPPPPPGVQGHRRPAVGPPALLPPRDAGGKPPCPTRTLGGGRQAGEGTRGRRGERAGTPPARAAERDPPRPPERRPARASAPPLPEQRRGKGAPGREAPGSPARSLPPSPAAGPLREGMEATRGGGRGRRERSRKSHDFPAYINHSLFFSTGCRLKGAVSPFSPQGRVPRGAAADP